MKTNLNEESRNMTRLSNDELRKSRAGLLGRFPPPDLYEPEEEEQTGDSDLSAIQKSRLGDQENGKPQ